MNLEERNDYVVENMNLVHYIAHKLRVSPYAYYSYEDLVQEGMVGLIQAVDRFKPELGFQFSTYATMMIRGNMLRFIRDNQYGMKYTRGDIDACTKIFRSGKNLNEISAQDLEELGINPKHLSAIISMIPSSLDAPSSADADNDLVLMDQVSASNEEFSEEFYEGELEHIKDQALIKLSSDNARDCIDEWYYSKLLGMPAGQTYLSSKYKVSQAQVSRWIKAFKEQFRLLLVKSGYDADQFDEE